jgi:D-arabinose 1-dehydrogenase-like Zn-dependent alcohol dehydrogenase
MGFDTVAIARGDKKELLAKELGANHYIDSTTQNVADAPTSPRRGPRSSSRP